MKRVSRPFLVPFVALALVASLLVGSGTTPASAAVPAGFAEQLLLSGLNGPTAMALAPDGRIFVAEQTGQLRVIKNGTILPTPFLSVNVDFNGERGLVGVVLHPNFATNGFVYVYYTTATSPVHNRISRFTANGDVAVPGSETVIMDLDPLNTVPLHNGGAMHFGPAGRLYIATGDNSNGANAQTLNNRLGKILRINADGTIPTDNPFYTTATGANRSIWALGLRNPFTFAFKPGASRMLINDVGQETWEEINDGIAGSNYGWPTTEGPTADPRFRSPIFAYQHGDGSTQGCAITGGAFYDPPTQQFPAQYVGKYFFADFCNGWIRTLDPTTNVASGFSTIGTSPIDIDIASDGSLYYLTRGGSIFRVRYTASGAPSINAHPSNQTVSVGGTATFTATANGTQPLSYQWQRNGVDIAGATGSTYSRSNVQPADNGAQFRVRVSNSLGSVLSNAAALTVTSNKPPSANITQPQFGALYRGGQTINYAGTGTDPETGDVGAQGFTWRVDFHHAQHVHPFIPATSGAKSGSFTVPTSGHTEANVWYRIYLTVRDPAGLTVTKSADVHPETSQITLKSYPGGLPLFLDGQTVTAPHTFTGVVGIQRTLSAPATQTRNGTTYQFLRWGDGGARTHVISTPARDRNYTAIYRATAGSALRR